MNDAIITCIPGEYQKIKEATEELKFNMASDLLYRQFAENPGCIETWWQIFRIRYWYRPGYGLATRRS